MKLDETRSHTVPQQPSLSFQLRRSGGKDDRGYFLPLSPRSCHRKTLCPEGGTPAPLCLHELVAVVELIMAIAWAKNSYFTIG